MRMEKTRTKEKGRGFGFSATSQTGEPAKIAEIALVWANRKNPPQNRTVIIWLWAAATGKPLPGVVAVGRRQRHQAESTSAAGRWPASHDVCCSSRARLSSTFSTLAAARAGSPSIGLVRRSRCGRCAKARRCRGAEGFKRRPASLQYRAKRRSSSFCRIMSRSSFPSVLVSPPRTGGRRVGAPRGRRRY